MFSSKLGMAGGLSNDNLFFVSSSRKESSECLNMLELTRALNYMRIFLKNLDEMNPRVLGAEWLNVFLVPLRNQVSRSELSHREYQNIKTVYRDFHRQLEYITYKACYN
jgi:hypothetical protein